MTNIKKSGSTCFILGAVSLTPAFFTLIFFAPIIGSSGGVGVFLFLVLSWSSYFVTLSLSGVAIIAGVSFLRSNQASSNKTLPIIGLVLAFISILAASCIFVAKTHPTIKKMSTELYRNQNNQSVLPKK